jgi:uncharacterized membrane protein YgcG
MNNSVNTGDAALPVNNSVSVGSAHASIATTAIFFGAIVLASASTPSIVPLLWLTMGCLPSTAAQSPHSALRGHAPTPTPTPQAGSEEEAAHFAVPVFVAAFIGFLVFMAKRARDGAAVAGRAAKSAKAAAEGYESPKAGDPLLDPPAPGSAQQRKGALAAMGRGGGGGGGGGGSRGGGGGRGRGGNYYDVFNPTGYGGGGRGVGGEINFDTFAGQDRY